jgi:hypothetical protein
MSSSRFTSQIVPTDSTESKGYMFYPVSAIPTSGLISYATYANIASGAPCGVQLSATTAGTVVSQAAFVPHDLDSSATCYASLVYASVTTATTATCTAAITYQNFTTGSTIVAPAVTCGAVTGFTAAATIGYVAETNTCAMSTKPTPGTLLAFKVVADPLVADTISLIGVKMQYTRRFV